MNKDKLKDFAKQLKAIDKQVSDLFDEKQKIELDRNKFLVEYVLETKLLNTIEWEVANTKFINGSYLTTKFKELYKLSGDAWSRLKVSFTPDITLIVNLDDHNVYLEFNKDLDFKFIKEHGLKLTFKETQKEIDELSQRIDILNKIMELKPNDK